MRSFQKSTVDRAAKGLMRKIISLSSRLLTDAKMDADDVSVHGQTPNVKTMNA
jgi:hypothetical protein